MKNSKPYLTRILSIASIFLSWSVPAVNVNAAEIRNAVFIISDDLKASVLGCYGDQICKTPHIDRLAERSIVFERAYCQGTTCAPSRQSLMFSRYQGKGPVNFGQYFREQGIFSARVGKIYHMKVPGDIIAGTDGRDEPSSWTEKFNSPGREAHTPGDYACLNLNVFTTEEANRQSTAMPHRMFVSVRYSGDGADQPDHRSATTAIRILNQRKDAPFFLAVGLVRPHYPMVAPQKYFDMYPWRDMPLPAQMPNDLEDIPKPGHSNITSFNNGIGRFPENQKRMWAAYYASVTFMDEQVGRILDELDRLNLTDSTAIVFCSDHGYHLGEHGFWQKANLHEDVLRVPLLISAPGYQAGRSRSLVELVDVFPTVAELVTGVEPAQLHGTTLVPVMRNTSVSVKDGVLSFSNGHCLRTDEFSYILYRDGSEELYDMTADPGQFNNLAFQERTSSLRGQLRKKLETRLSTFGLKRAARRR